MNSRLFNGDCACVLTIVEANSIDACLCDPPYGLSFMGESWDHDVPGPDHWRAALRVLKPGAHLLAFGGTRTFHRLTCAIEEAGFEIRDCLQWLYGQGFPKSLNGTWGGTALKPGWEPIVLARKPLIGTVAANVAAHGTGGLNIDACRIATDWSERSEAWKRSGRSAKPEADKIAAPPGTGINCHPKGRWPANVLMTHDERCELVGTNPGPNGLETAADWRCAEGCPVRMLDEQAGNRGAHSIASGQSVVGGVGFGRRGKARGEVPFQDDRGGPSRFFYCGKATSAERGDGNHHPTVKPIELLRYLLRLITPPGGTVLDQYMGSGSTGVAAVSEGFSFIGVDIDEKNVAIAERRIAAVSPLFAAAETAE